MPKDDEAEIEILIPVFPESDLGECRKEMVRRIFQELGWFKPWPGMFFGEPRPQRNHDAER